MDEYLFTVLAKLKADRLQLERAARDRKLEELDDYQQGSQSSSPSPRARRSASPAAGSVCRSFRRMVCAAGVDCWWNWRRLDIGQVVASDHCFKESHHETL